MIFSVVKQEPEIEIKERPIMYEEEEIDTP